MLVAADDAALRKARASARTLAALRDVKADPPRLSRFNKEQRDQLDERLAAAEERVPQQVAMAFRHLLLFTERNGQLSLETIDLLIALRLPRSIMCVMYKSPGKLALSRFP